MSPLVDGRCYRVTPSNSQWQPSTLFANTTDMQSFETVSIFVRIAVFKEIGFKKGLFIMVVVSVRTEYFMINRGFKCYDCFAKLFATIIILSFHCHLYRSYF